MKRLALVAALAGLAVLPACTTFHKDRRSLTQWNLELIKDTAKPSPAKSPESWHADGVAHPVINYVFVEPIAAVMLPVSWLGDTLIVNPVNGFKKAQLQHHERRFGCDDQRGVVESQVKDYGTVVPWVPPWPVSDVLAAPEFLARWAWNSTYPTDPVNQDSYNAYWDEHNEQFTH